MISARGFGIVDKGKMVKSWNVWYVGNLGKEAFDDFVREAAAASAYDTGIVPEYGDQLVILSTCSYHTANGRFVVAARRLPEEHK